ncbi:MAG: hypothetical protein QOD49_2266, partial [Actinomycetota bacterium]|nr:hypothetical protein [Actinomycetota bacterium]
MIPLQSRLEVHFADLIRHKGVTRHATAGAFVFCR